MGRSKSRPRRRGRRARRGGAGRARGARPDRHALLSQRLVAGFVDTYVVGMALVALDMAVVALAGVGLSGTSLIGILAALVAEATAYQLVGVAVWGQTVGRRLTGIRVVRSDTFDVPGWRRAAVRAVGLWPLGWAPYGDAAVLAGQVYAFGRTRQGLHDLVAGTMVVDDRAWQRWRGRSGSHA